MEIEEQKTETKPAGSSYVTKAAIFLALIGIFTGLAISLYAFLDLGGTLSYLVNNTPSYAKPFFNLFTIGLTWILAVLLIAYILVDKVLFVKKNGSRNLSTSGDISAFSLYFAFFMFLGLMVSTLESLAGIAPTSLGLPDSSAIIVYGYTAIIFSVLMQLVPIAVIVFLAKHLEASGSISKDPVIKRRREFEIITISAAIDLIIGYFLPFLGPDSISFLLSVLVLNYICLKAGFLRSLLVNFTATLLSVASFLVLSNGILSLLVTVFVLIWALVGFAWVMSILLKPRPAQDINEKREEMAKRYVEQTDYSKLWVRSTCPVCGESRFLLQPDMSLKCEKCGNIIDKDQEGKLNIIVQNRRVM